MCFNSECIPRKHCKEGTTHSSLVYKITMEEDNIHGQMLGGKAGANFFGVVHKPGPCVWLSQCPFHPDYVVGCQTGESDCHTLALD